MMEMSSAEAKAGSSVESGGTTEDGATVFQGPLTNNSPAQDTETILSKKDELPPEIEHFGRLRTLFIILCMSMSIFLVALDRGIIATAIPKITDEFRSFSDVSWYGAAYLLAATAFQPSWGKVYQNFPLKRVFAFVMILFLIGSVICAIAPDSTVLIVGRAVAGLGSGGILLGILTMMNCTIPLHRRPAFTGGITALFVIGSLVGPILGGVFTDKLSWRWCFYINLPPIVITVFVTVFMIQIPSDMSEQGKKTMKERLNDLDYIGPVIYIPGIVSLLLALQWGGSKYPWNSRVIVSLFIASGVLIPLWMFSQFRLGEKATIPTRIMTQRTVLCASLFAFLIGATSIVFIYYIPLYFQAVRNSSATLSAVDVIPLVISVIVSSIIGGALVPKIGYFVPFMIVGAALISIGSGLLSTVGVTTSTSVWSVFEVITGLGSGLCTQMPMLAVQAAVEPRDSPIAGAVYLLLQQLGPAVFITVAQTIFLNTLLPRLQAINPDLSKTKILEAGATGFRGIVTESDLPVVLTEYAKSIDVVFQIATALGATAAILALCVEWKSIKKEKREENELKPEE